MTVLILNDFIIFSSHIVWLYNLASQFDAIYCISLFKKMEGRIIGLIILDKENWVDAGSLYIVH